MPASNSLSRWIPPLCWMVVIFFMSTDVFSGAHTSIYIEPIIRWLMPHATRQRVEFIHFCIRKCAHLTEYGILGVLLWRALPEWAEHPVASDWLRACSALFVATCYAATDEYHQSFIPSRTSTIHDVVIDACGAAIALACLSVASMVRTRRRPLASLAAE